MKMRLKMISLLLTFVVTGTWADDISQDEAQQIAVQAFWQLHHSSPVGAKAAARSKAKQQPVLTYTMQKEGQPADLYVFNSSADGNDGFVIVAGDDRVLCPVIGYSEQGHFKSDDVPHSLKSLLACYANQIAYLRELPQNVTKVKRAPSSSSSVFGNVIVEPFVTTKWNQGTPFNNMCPKPDGKNLAVTGCVATAIAQVMAYWKHPKQGRGRNYYYWEPTPGKRFDWGGDLSAHVYDWDNMLDSYAGDYTETQAQAVAQLMSDIGISCDMVYGYGPPRDFGSMAIATGETLAKYFDYDLNTMHEIGVEIIAGYNEEEMQPKLEAFENSLRAELDEKRPVLFSANPSLESIVHEIVVDGYTDANYFHMNFGWSGQSDGYYQMMLIDVAASTVESRQKRSITELGAIIGVQPAKSIVRDNVSYTLNGDEAELSFVDFKGELTVPETITDDDGKNYPVTSISLFAIQDNDTLVGLNLPNTIKRIPKRAFAQSGLTSIVFPPSVSAIPDYVCYGCQNLETVGISEGIDKIGESAFEDCPKILQVSSWASEIGKKAFCGTRELYAYNFSQVRKIGDAAFAGCPFNTLSFEVLEEAGNNIFWAGSTPAVYIGANVTVSNLNWLPWQMKTLTVSPDNPLYFDCNNTVYDRDMTTIYYCGRNATNVDEGTDNFSHLHKVQVVSDNPRTELVIPETVTRIVPRSLQVNSNCKLVIPASVTEMSENSIVYREVYNYATTPQVIEDWSEEVQGTLHVPAGCKDVYAAANGWKKYTTIVDDLPAPGDEPATHEPVNGVYVITRYWWNQFVIKNSPVLYFQIPFSEHPVINYQDDGTFIVTGDNGVSYYNRSDKATVDSYTVPAKWNGNDDCMVKLSFFNDGSATGIKALNLEKMGSQIVIDGRDISVHGLQSGTSVALYALDGRILAKGQSSSNGQSVVSLPGDTSSGVYILKVGNSSFKINAK